MFWMSDPGHGWLVVMKEDVIASGAKITPYSYEADGLVYLEEDCDAGSFIEAAGLDFAVVRDLPEREGNPRGFKSFQQNDREG